MPDFGAVDGIVFDFGGTLDTHGDHWACVIHDAYRSAGLTLVREHFFDAYVHAERALAAPRMVGRHDTFHTLLSKKIALQLDYLDSSQRLTARYAEAVVAGCYDRVKGCMASSRELLSALGRHVPLALASNFYGNLDAVLREFGCHDIFTAVIDSAVVGVRKPDPEIFRIACRRLGIRPTRAVIVGDSVSNDIRPAKAIGCMTARVDGRQWNPDTSDPDIHPIMVSDIRNIINTLLTIINHITL